MNENQYQEMWEKDFGMKSAPPDYQEYLKREVYKQDYLDLFRTSKSETYPRMEVDGVFYVNIMGRKLMVEYDYPFRTALRANKDRKIKYVLIGEAPNKPNTSKVHYGMVDDKNTYFYNVLHVGATDYFDAPIKAFGIKHSSKQSSLVELANKGAVLLDLFPFAIKYNNSIRSSKKVKEIGNRRFNEILADLEYDTSKERVCFICSTIHASYIINSIISSRSHHMSTLTELSNSDWVRWITKYTKLTPSVSLNSLSGNWHGLTGNLTIIDSLGSKGKRIHKYRSIGKTMSYNCIPHEIPIRFAFDL